MTCRVCEVCQRKPATVHITEIPKGGEPMREAHFCDDCAASQKRGLFEKTGLGRDLSTRIVRRTPAPGAPCDRCGKGPATVHDTRIVDWKVVKEENLCEDCAPKASPELLPHRAIEVFPNILASSLKAPDTLAEQVRSAVLEAAEVKRCFGERAAAEIAQAVEIAAHCLQSGGKVLLCGNGGSAAEAQHIAAELVGRFKLERPALPAIALTTNTSILTAIGNDYSFDDIFARQVGGLGAPGDVLFAYSTSGTSKNILRAIQAAKIVGMKTVGFTGASGGDMAKVCDVCIKAPSEDTPTVQECHTAAGHTICRFVEQMLFGGDKAPQ